MRRRNGSHERKHVRNKAHGDATELQGFLPPRRQLGQLRGVHMRASPRRQDGPSCCGRVRSKYNGPAWQLLIGVRSTQQRHGLTKAEGQLIMK